MPPAVGQARASGVEQNRLDDGLHAPAHAVPVVGERRRDALDVSGARVRGHEALNEAARDEGTHVRMPEQVVNGGVDVLQAGLPRGNVPPANEVFRAGFVVLFVHAHRPRPHRLAVAEVAVGTVERKAREDLRQLGDVVVVVRGNRLPASVPQVRSVRFELEQPDRKELHDLARVVLVGESPAAGIGLVVAEMREVRPHDGVERDVPKNVPVVPERVPQQHVVVVRGADRASRHGVGIVGDHEDLAQRQRDPLAKRIRTAHDLVPPRPTPVLRRHLQPRAEPLVEEGLVVADRPRELLVEPEVGAEARGALDLSVVGAERGLRQEARSLGRRHRRAGRRRGRRGSEQETQDRAHHPLHHETLRSVRGGSLLQGMYRRRIPPGRSAITSVNHGLVTARGRGRNG